MHKMAFFNAFERYCRLCAEEHEVTILLFSPEAEALLLQSKLNKYLLLEVDEYDKLPKNVCINCCSKLQHACEFIDSARKAQEILLNRISNQNFYKQDDMQTDDICSEMSIKCENSDQESQSSLLQVNVDPMTVLQNSEGSPSLSSNEEKMKSNELEDVTNLYAVDNADVSIKLIKRGDTSQLSMDNNIELKIDVNKPFPCLTCNRSFCTELALKNHSWIHKNEEKAVTIFNCSSCNAQFDSKTKFLVHLKKHRTSGLCKLCGRVFRTEKNLAMHMANHTSATAFICKVCGRSYSTQSNLKNHSIAHSTARPYQCNICKKGFKRRQDLKFHINQHTGAKPYKCPFCDKSFASSGNCYSHRTRMHPGWRNDCKIRRRQGGSQENHTKTFAANIKSNMKYHCNLCDHTFMKRDNYMYHVYKHTGKKPFQCLYCSEEFVTRRGLCIHHEKKHPEKDRPLGLLTRNVLLK